MQLYFIRHGQSANNLIWTQTRQMQGRVPDPHLTETGEAQAQQVARFLAQPYSDSNPHVDYHNTNGFGITHLYCSLMTRAIETGLPIAAALQLPLVALPTIHEFRGIYQAHQVGETFQYAPLAGPNRRYFEEQFPTVVLPETLQEVGWSAPQLETHGGMYQRAKDVIAWVQAHHSADDRVAIVSHGGFYQAIIYALLHYPDLLPDQYPSTLFSINNCAITRIYFDDDFTAISYANKVDHLPPGLHTR